MENSNRSKKKASAFSLSPETDAKITAIAEAEMGGNRSKWLELHLVQFFAQHSSTG